MTALPQHSEPESVLPVGPTLGGSPGSEHDRLLAAIELAAYRAKSPFERASILELSNAVRAAVDAGIPAMDRLRAARRGRKRAEAAKVRFLNAEYRRAYGRDA